MINMIGRCLIRDIAVAEINRGLSDQSGSIGINSCGFQIIGLFHPLGIMDAL